MPKIKSQQLLAFLLTAFCLLVATNWLWQTDIFPAWQVHYFGQELDVICLDAVL